MKISDRFLSFIFLLITCVAHGAENPEELMLEELRKSAMKFESIGSAALDKPLPFKISLAANTVKVGNDAVFGGFRFKAPENVSGADLVWYFNAPEGWANWYILPVSEKFRPAFKNWLYADKVYEGLDTAAAPGRLRALQTLASDYFQPGQEYLIWFRDVENSTTDDLRGTLTFAKPDGEWDVAKIETALALKPQPAAEQVKQLGSRGGRILLDEKFFEKSYAQQRVESVFFSKRQTQFLEDGTAITMETTIPPCKTLPPMAEIRKAFGDPDFTVTSKEESLISHRKKDDPATITYYYDYFGFEVNADDPSQLVQHVTANAANYANLVPKQDGKQCSELILKNLTCFYDDKKEVGRIYFFNDRKTAPTVTQEPPVGIYKSADGELAYLGAGKWRQKTFHENGKLARLLLFEKNVLNGLCEGYYPDGSKNVQATYKDGKLDGEFVEYSEDGKEERFIFKDGKRVTK